MGVEEDNYGGRFLEARRKQCRDLSEEEGQDTLMLVRPKGQPIEGLSYNGETAEGGGRDVQEDQVMEGSHGLPDVTRQAEEKTDGSDSGGEDEGAEEESRAAVGKKSPKEPTKKQREDHETHTHAVQELV